jgi:hypothetical protein
MRALKVALGIGMALLACKQPPPLPTVKPSVQAERSVAAPKRDPQEHRLVRDEFELDENADDPAAALESLRHNCCDEMPASELRTHVHQSAAPGRAK